MSLYDELEKIEKEQATAVQESTDEKPKEKTDSKSSDTKPDVKTVEADSGDDTETKAGARDNDSAKTSADDKKEKTPQEEKIDSAAFAQLRRDKAAAERRAKALEDQIKQQATQPVVERVAEVKAPPAAADQEPDANLDPEAHLRWKLSKTEAQLNDIAKWKESVEKQNNDRRLRDNAVKAYTKYENDFSPTVKDYKEVTGFGLNQIAASIRTLNPRLQGEALQEAVRMQVFRIAAEAEKQGHDPAEHFYNTARAWGYQEPKAEAPVTKAEEKPRPSLKTVVDNKRKTAGALAHGGKSGNNSVSREAIPGMSFSEFARLTPQQLRDLEA